MKEAVAPRVVAAVDAVLGTLGADADAECWVVWGDDAMIRWTMLVPTLAGLVALAVRPASADGARVAGKLVRWQRVQIGEFSVDYQVGHRVVGVSVEGTVLRGADVEADAIGAFLQTLYQAIDGRTALAAPPARPAGRRPARGKAARTAEAPPAKPAPPPIEPDIDEDDDLDGDLPALPSGLPAAPRPAARPPAAAPPPPSASGLPALFPSSRPSAVPAQTAPAAPAAPGRTAPSAPGQSSPPTSSRPAPPASARPAVENPSGPLARRLAAGIPPAPAPRSPGRPDDR